MKKWLIGSVVLALIAANVLYYNQPTAGDIIAIATISGFAILGFELFAYTTEDMY